MGSALEKGTGKNSLGQSPKLYHPQTHQKMIINIKKQLEINVRVKGINLQ